MLRAHHVEHAECMGNIVLVGATGWHEWPGAVGVACLPILLVLLCHLYVLFVKREHFMETRE